MLVDDSIVARSVIQSILAPHPRFQVVATASGAAQALAALDRTAVDVVLLDLAMPGIDGLTALPEIVRRGRGARVIVVSASAGAGAADCIRALTLGAVDTLEKPAAGFGQRFVRDLLDKLVRIEAEGPVATPDAVEGRARDRPVALAKPIDEAIACIAIGASTGGLHALTALFGALDPACDAPIAITQHLPATFMPYFAEQIAAVTGRRCTVAREGEALRRGAILVAPGDAHLRLRRTHGDVRVRLDREPVASGCLPSVDPMFEAVANCFGPQGFGVVLSGMGRDGLVGARRLVEAGGEVAVQDRATSVVWGMPGSVAAAGLAATIAEPPAIARRLAERALAAGARRPRT
jgi:two-component system chemotaxis response regulator CheB